MQTKSGSPAQTVAEIATENNSTTLFPIPIELFRPFLTAAENRAALDRCFRVFTLAPRAPIRWRRCAEGDFDRAFKDGAAAMLLADDTILTGTSPEAINPSVEVCHELEPYCGAHRLGQSVVASVCLHRKPGGQVVVLSPCGVCRERLAVHGPDVLVAVAAPLDPTVIVWKPLKDVLPDYWMTAFPDEIDSAWRS